MTRTVTGAISNVRGGLAGLLIYGAITACIYGTAFIAAFGNDTPASQMVLQLAGLYFLVANPLWAIPLSYFTGGLLLFQNDKVGSHVAVER